MKFIVIFFIIAQVCAEPNTSISAPPHYYVQKFDSYKEAKKRVMEIELNEGGKAEIIYGELVDWAY